MGLHSSKPRRQAQILMLGLDGAGKTTLLYRLKYNESVVTVPTVGFNVEMLDTAKRGAGLTVWDVGGQRKMRPHWQHHYADTACLVFVVDSWDLRRLGETRKELHQVLKCPSLQRVPLVVLANKQDLCGALSPAELSLKLDLRRLCGDRAWFVQPCSAITGTGLEEGFRRVVYLLKTALEQTEEDVKDKFKKLKGKGFAVMTMKPVLRCG
ncbi:ADP-ribosylation factor-like protein 14 [Lampris incognitus]|uniref:ADP-ribosylation factor-like protein 14 n=1 Tax=Lampris incognitus TaxID=2546036 RepID=UPI0024B603B8|nr:ADP-ribosylation factor-like protein 14 [Lampris incognitus]